MLLEDFSVPETFMVDQARPLNELNIFARKKTAPPVRFLVSRPERVTVEVGSSRYHIRKVADTGSWGGFTVGWTIDPIDAAPVPRKRDYPSVKDAVHALTAALAK